MKVSKDLVDFVKQAEGFRAEAYQPLPGDKWTIGYGSTFTTKGAVKQGDTITEVQATQEIEINLNTFSANLSIYDENLTQQRLDAATSLAYNIGVTKFLNSETGQIFKSGGDISSRFILWNKFSGKTNKGLSERRLRETQIYKNGNYSQELTEDSLEILNKLSFN